MAPGKKRAPKENKSKIAKNNKGFAIKKAKKSSVPKKKLKERTFQHIEEVDKKFTAIHDVLVRKESKTAKPEVEGKKNQRSKVGEKKAILSNEVTQEELSETVESIASL